SSKRPSRRSNDTRQLSATRPRRSPVGAGELVDDVAVLVAGQWIGPGQVRGAYVPERELLQYPTGTAVHRHRGGTDRACPQLGERVVDECAGAFRGVPASVRGALEPVTQCQHRGFLGTSVVPEQARIVGGNRRVQLELPD